MPIGPLELLTTVTTEVRRGPTLLAWLGGAEDCFAGGGAGTEEYPAGGAGGAEELRLGMAGVIGPVGTEPPGTDETDAG